MIKITNKQKSPIQLLVRSKLRPRAFTCLNVPGIGAGKNVVYIEDEMKTPYIEKAENAKLITTQFVKSRTED